MYSPKDSSAVINPSYMSYFHGTYDDCRLAFRNASKELSVKFDSVVTGIISVPDRIDNDLSIDWSYMPARGSKTKLLIINSGLHGIEGYTGNAVQLMFMDKILSGNFP